MLETSKKPVIFLAFANEQEDRVRYLRNLPEEARQIREPLRQAQRDGLCEVVELANATAKEIFDVFQDPEYRNRIAVFHFGGHANGYQLLLESSSGQTAVADAGGFASFLGQQNSLQLVFLNGCSTQPQVRGLLDANVATVIATSRSIDDQVAMLFAKRFYQGLSGGASLQTAFKEAESGVQTEKGSDTRSLHFGSGDRREQGATDLDRWPWELNVKEGAESVVEWSLPLAVGNPLFGLKPLEALDLPPRPFRHLHWFDREHANIFFGRGQQIRNLYDLVNNANSAPVILLYGQSGVGKSSMLAAGLIPRLSQDCEVRYVRRHRDGGLVKTLRAALQPAGESESNWSEGDVVSSWRKLENQLAKPLVVIVDQAEECFTRPDPDSPDELDEFLDECRNLFLHADQRPQGRLILGFRKEWLAEIERRLLERKIPTAKVFIERLSREGIIEAIEGPAKSPRLQEQYSLTIEEGLADIIADDLLEDRDSAIAPILQILLTKMWDKATERNQSKPRFDQDLYWELRREGIMLEDFLDQQLDELRSWRDDVVDSGLVLDLLTLHTTALGSADQRNADELPGTYPHRVDVLQPLIQRCKDLYLLVDPSQDRKTETECTRLAHDTLAPLVRARFEESDKPGQRARRILENRVVDWQGEQTGTPLDIQDLKIVEQGRAGTRALSSVEQRLFDASYVERTKRLRVQKTLKILGMVAVTAIAILALIATVSWNRSVANERAARESLKVAKVAVDEMLAKVGSESLKNVPQMEQVRGELLEKASALYKQLAAQNSNGNETARHDQALAHFSLGKIHRILDKHKQAREEFQMAIDQLKKLAAESSDPDQYNFEIAQVNNQFGDMLRRDSITKEEARKKFTVALEQIEKLDDGNRMYLAEKALIHNNRGVLLSDLGKTKEAKSDYDATVELLKQEVPSQYRTASENSLTPVDNKMKDCLYYLAYGYNNRAILSKDSNPDLFTEGVDTTSNTTIKQMEDDHESAITLMTSLVKLFPDDRSYTLRLAEMTNNFAELRIKQELLELADPLNQQARELLLELSDAVPDVRSALAKSYLNKATIFAAQAKFEDAFEYSQKAKDILVKLVNDASNNQGYADDLNLANANLQALGDVLNQQSNDQK